MRGREADLLELLPTAEQAVEKVALAEARKAAAEMKKRQLAEVEKRALLAKLQRASGVSDAEALKRVTAIIQRAVSNGRLDVEVHRFSNTLCMDCGRAINQQEPGWEATLTGVPREMYEFWQRHLKARGYKFVCQIVEFPGGSPGDVSIFLKWG
jgi:hypothetical protein